MYDKLLKGFSFIYGIDQPETPRTIPDSILTYENSFLIYKDIGVNDKVGRIAMDLREYVCIFCLF